MRALFTLLDSDSYLSEPARLMSTVRRHLLPFLESVAQVRRCKSCAGACVPRGWRITCVCLCRSVSGVYARMHACMHARTNA